MTILTARYADASNSAVLVKTDKDGDVFLPGDQSASNQGSAFTPLGNHPYATALAEWIAGGGAIAAYTPPADTTPQEPRAALSLTAPSRAAPILTLSAPLTVLKSVVADLTGTTITQDSGTNLPTLVTVDTGTASGAVSKTDLSLFVDGNRAANSTVVGVAFETFRKSLARTRVGAVNCDTGVRIKGNVEFAKFDVAADMCGVGLHVTSEAGGSTPDELIIDMTAHQCDTFFKADGVNKTSGIVRVVGEQSDSWGIEIGSGWWNVTGEIRGVGTVGGGGYRQYEGWTVAAGEVNVTGNLMVVGGHSLNCGWLISIEAGRLANMIFPMFGNYKAGARVLGGVASGSSAQFTMFNYPSNGPALELGGTATLNNFHVMAGSVLVSATVAANLVRAVNCTIDADVLSGQIVIGTNSSGNIINVPRQNFGNVTVVNSRATLDNIIVFKGRHTLASLQGRTDLIRGMQAEAVADYGGAMAYYDGTRWVPSHGVVASGTATILAVATSVAIAHGLGASPAISEIQVVPTSNIGTAKNWWVSAITSTTITLSLDTAPGTAVTFSWVVRKIT